MLCQCSEISIRWLRPANRIFYVKPSANILTTFIQSKYKKRVRAPVWNVAAHRSKNQNIWWNDIIFHTQRDFFHFLLNRSQWVFQANDSVLRQIAKQRANATWSEFWDGFSIFLWKLQSIFHCYYSSIKSRQWAKCSAKFAICWK